MGRRACSLAAFYFHIHPARDTLARTGNIILTSIAAIFPPRVRGTARSQELLRRYSVHNAKLEPTAKITHAHDAALVFGGDGSLHFQLEALVDLGIPFLVAPVGSGNDFARGLGIRDEDAALKSWNAYLTGKGNLKNLDAGMIREIPGGREHYFCNVGGAGLDAVVNRRANAMPAWLRAHGGYTLAALYTIATYRPQRMTALFAGEGQTSIAGPAWFAAFANAAEYGGGMRIAPRATPDDGKLDLVFIHAFNRLRVFRFFHTVFSGDHLKVREVEYHQTPWLRLESESPLPVYADGEYVCETPVEAAVRRNALRVIVPVLD